MSTAPGPASERGNAWRRYGVAAGLLSMLVALGWALPRAIEYDALLEENLALKARLREVDHTLSESERILLRLRLYDAQLRSLSDPKGPHGPTRAPTPVASGEPMEPIHDSDWDAIQEAVGVRPAEVWADAVNDRAAQFLALFERAEPNLSGGLADMEELRALEASLPEIWPAIGDVTSDFGWRRDPLRGGWDFHSGLDISNRRGTPIRAPAPGRVVRAFYNSGYGRMVEIDHGFGITTVYAHCHVLRVKKGDQVQTGDLIATLGSTGRSTGPHLHFEVRLDGHAVNPLDYIGPPNP